MRSFSSSTIVKANPQVFSCVLATGQALLDLRTSVYYSINSVGSFIWEQLKSPVSIEALESAVQSEFAVDAERCRRDLDALLNQFADADLVEIEDDDRA